MKVLLVIGLIQITVISLYVNITYTDAATVGVCINKRPTVSTTNCQKVAAISELYSCYVSATDGDLDQTHEFFDNTPLFDVNQTSGLIKFTPINAQAGFYNINLTAKDNSGCSNSNGSAILYLSVSNATCFDGARNQNEEGIDCGGPCQAICSTKESSSSGSGTSVPGAGSSGTSTYPYIGSGYNSPTRPNYEPYAQPPPGAGSPYSITQKCPQATFFDPRSNSCVTYPQEISKIGTILSQCPPDQFWDESKCSLFEKKFQCPQGSFFDIKLNTCTVINREANNLPSCYINQIFDPLKNGCVTAKREVAVPHCPAGSFFEYRQNLCIGLPQCSAQKFFDPVKKSCEKGTFSYSKTEKCPIGSFFDEIKSKCIPFSPIIDKKTGGTILGIYKKDAAGKDLKEDVANAVRLLADVQIKIDKIDVEKPLEVSSQETRVHGLNSVGISFNQNLQYTGTKVDLSVLDDLPESDDGQKLTKIAFGTERPIKVFRIKVPEEIKESIKGATINFTLEKTDINETELGEIILLRVSNNKWQALDTIVSERKEDGSVDFTSTTPGFSFFVVSKKPLAVNNQTSIVTDNSKKGIEGIYLPLALSIVLSAVVILITKITMKKHFTKKRISSRK